MADCAYLASVPSADGTPLQVYAAAPGPCSGYVVLTPAEYAHLAANPFNLSIQDGVTVSGAVASVWLLAWVARALVRALGSDGDERVES